VRSNLKKIPPVYSIPTASPYFSSEHLVLHSAKKRENTFKAYMMKRVRAIWALLFGLFSCSTITTLDIDSSRRNQYEDYLQNHLKVEKLYLKLRETASGKALKVTPELTELQSHVVPGFEAKAASGNTLFVVSLEMPDWSRFSIADFKFYWGESASKSVKEIMDGQLLQTL
jgi:hypothetical protein